MSPDIVVWHLRGHFCLPLVGFSGAASELQFDFDAAILLGKGRNGLYPNWRIHVFPEWRVLVRRHLANAFALFWVFARESWHLVHNDLTDRLAAVSRDGFSVWASYELWRRLLVLFMYRKTSVFLIGHLSWALLDKLQILPVLLAMTWFWQSSPMINFGLILRFLCVEVASCILSNSNKVLLVYASVPIHRDIFRLHMEMDPSLETIPIRPRHSNMLVIISLLIHGMFLRTVSRFPLRRQNI